MEEKSKRVSKRRGKRERKKGKHVGKIIVKQFRLRHTLKIYKGEEKSRTIFKGGKEIKL